MAHSPVAPGGAVQPPLRVRKYRDVKAAYVGEPGTPERSQFELELTLELLPLKIKEFRKEQRLTQAELGARLGVHKAQISKLERNPVNVTVDTLLKVFAALHTKIKIGFEAVPPGPPQLAALLLLAALLQALAHQPGLFCGQVARSHGPESRRPARGSSGGNWEALSLRFHLDRPESRTAPHF